MFNIVLPLILKFSDINELDTDKSFAIIVLLTEILLTIKLSDNDKFEAIIWLFILSVPFNIWLPKTDKSDDK